MISSEIFLNDVKFSVQIQISYLYFFPNPITFFHLSNTQTLLRRDRSEIWMSLDFNGTKLGFLIKFVKTLCIVPWNSENFHIFPEIPPSSFLINSEKYLNTILPIIIELMALRTPAFVTSQGIDAITVTARWTITLILIYTLIVVQMLDKSLWTSAAISPHEVLHDSNNETRLLFTIKNEKNNEEWYLASMLTTSILAALIIISTEFPSMIKFESPWTNTPEASECIDASSRFWTSSVLLALVYIWKKIFRMSQTQKMEFPKFAVEHRLL